jgi:uncharacterized protein YecE (DUF72 family)
MTDQLRLFDDGGAVAVGAAAPTAETRRLAAALPPVVRLGTSSWSFPGWAGLVWDREVDARTLARQGLAAYARHPLLGAVGVDRSYYAPLPVRAFRAMASAVPDGFRFVVKASERTTAETFSDHPRHGASRGRANPGFLDPAWAAEQVVAPAIEGLGHRAGPLVFQFPPRRIDDPAAFVDRLHRFLDALPAGPTYAVEVRSRALCSPRLAEALRAAGAIACLTVHPSMPPLRVQAATLAAALEGTVLVRWMLGHGQAYEAARARYAPFDRLVDEDVVTRRAVAEVVLRGVRRRQLVYVTVNNKAEGSAPRSIVALAREIVGRVQGAEQ